MPYPSLEQYNEALQSPQLVLLDAELKRGSLKTTGLGLPLALCGGFALTYTVSVGAKKYALRCFHKESRELERRYQAISARLAQLSSAYFLPFEFQPSGIRIQGGTYPIVKMAWANGRTLAEFLEVEHGNKVALEKLRGALAALAGFLEANNISHGDIQSENLMVGAGGGSIQLIDYDGMYVDALRGAQATELGQVNFQHPQRSAGHFSSKLDRFSFITLDVALQALIEKPALWASSRSEPSAVIFRRNDFLDPSRSAVFQEAVAIPSIRDHVENLAKVANASFDSIPSLSEFLQGKGVPVGHLAIPKATARIAYQSPYPVCDATSYSQVLAMVGSRVELIGRIHSVKKGWAQNRKPYVFVNFSDWRGQAVKLAIWVDGLDVIKPHVPDETWVGRWVSVVGLVDPPFSNKVRSHSYTHLSITITAAGQIQTIAEQEAKFRLGAIGRSNTSGPPAPVTRNADILKGMGIKAPPAPPPQPRRPAIPPKTGNEAVLQAMQAAQAHRQKAAQQARSPAPPLRGGGGHQSPSASSNSGCLVVVAGGLILLLFRLLVG